MVIFRKLPLTGGGEYCKFVTCEGKTNIDIYGERPARLNKLLPVFYLWERKSLR